LHLALHSFPTRRSSDLIFKVLNVSQYNDLLKLISKRINGFLNVIILYACIRAIIRGYHISRKIKVLFVIRVEIAYGNRALAAFLDRKSTRLNSSHVKIS